MTEYKKNLALYGAKPVIKKKFPNRFLYTKKEKDIINKVIDESIKTGNPFRYSGYYERLYEKRFVKFMGGGFADAVNSGTNALFSIIGALDIPVGSEIIVPILTDIGGVTPIIFWGCKPVISDISKDSFNSSLEEIKLKITSKTKAVIICHIGGDPADIIPIKKFLKKRNIFLIEDCSQSHGAEINDKKVGTFGDVSYFSTMSSKLHSTGGQGAVIYSGNKSIIERVRSVADRGKIFKNNEFTGKYNHLGINANLDELSAAIGCVQINKLNKIIFRTNLIGEKIKKILVKKSKIMKVGSQIKNSKCVYWFIRVNLDISKIKISKSIFCNALKAEGVPMSSAYDYNPFKYKWYSSKKTKELINVNHAKQDINIKPKNYNSMLDTEFVIFIRESFTMKDIDSIVSAMLKVENYFIK